MKQNLMRLYRDQLHAGRHDTARKILCLLNFGLYYLKDDIQTFQALSTVPGLLDQAMIHGYMFHLACWVILP